MDNRARKFLSLLLVLPLAFCLLTLPIITVSAQTVGTSLRFFGNGVNDIDRVKIRIDDPTNNLPGPPADIGAQDFTLEFWMRARAADNIAGAVTCGSNVNWINGNIIVDRDRYNADRKFGLSIAGGVLVFGVSGQGTGDLTLCGTGNVLDDRWHHVAVQRRRSDGALWLFVDGQLQAQADGPDGDISYPDDAIPGNFCGGPCVNSDPFLVIGAEKHDAGPSYPAYNGFVDELRLSNVLRYTAGGFARPRAPFTPDANTVALYHFDEGTGNVLNDVSGAVGGPSNGELRIGGSPAGPIWSPETPFLSDTVGIFRPSNTTFYLRNRNTTGPADITAVFGSSSDQPVAGDWNGDGIDTIGVYRTSTGVFFLKDANTTAAPVVYSFTLGNPGDLPMAGDWDGNGRDGVGTFRPTNGRLFLKNALTTGFADFAMVLGINGDRPVAGDWNGDGFDSPGVYRPSNAQFYLTNQRCNCTVFADYQLALGIVGDVGFAGDWDGNGISGVGVFRPTNGVTYLRNTLTTGFADVSLIYGIANDRPIAGRWQAPTSAPHTTAPEFGSGR